MAEDRGLCTHFKYHKKKLVLFLSAMRHFHKEGRAGLKMTYHRLDEKGAGDTSFLEKLGLHIAKEGVQRVHSFEIVDRFFREEIKRFLQERSIEWIEHRTPAFCFSLDVFQGHAQKSKKPFMKVFYEGVRKKTGVLMVDGKPKGGQYSYDPENRLPYRTKDRLKYPLPPERGCSASGITREVITLVEKTFPDHPGSTDGFNLPVTRSEAIQHFKSFVKERLPTFGPFEDAILQEDSRLFHSLLSPLINTGLLLPKEVIQYALKAHEEGAVDLPSVEGFVRQILGWREFIRGVDEVYGFEQEKLNYFGHKRKLKASWYEGTTGLPVLDLTIQKVLKDGYCHHIERLMILSNLMLLSGISPTEVHRWFMELFIDSADWVMGPNVYGMGQMSDGGIFATKPYICGSNYILKMSDFEKGDWCDVMDGLYWDFIDRNRSFFARNPRMAMAVKTFDRMNSARREQILNAAQQFIQKNTD